MYYIRRYLREKNTMRDSICFKMLALHGTYHSDMKLQQGQPKALKSSDLLKLGLPSIVATKACLNML